MQLLANSKWFEVEITGTTLFHGRAGCNKHPESIRAKNKSHFKKGLHDRVPRLQLLTMKRELTLYIVVHNIMPALCRFFIFLNTWSWKITTNDLLLIDISRNNNFPFFPFELKTCQLAEWPPSYKPTAYISMASTHVLQAYGIKIAKMLTAGNKVSELGRGPLTDVFMFLEKATLLCMFVSHAVSYVILMNILTAFFIDHWSHIKIIC